MPSSAWRLLFLLDLQSFLSLQLAASLLLDIKKTEGRAEHPVCREGCNGGAKAAGGEGCRDTAKIALAVWESQQRLFFLDSHTGTMT